MKTKFVCLFGFTFLLLIGNLYYLPGAAQSNDHIRVAILTENGNYDYELLGLDDRITVELFTAANQSLYLSAEYNCTFLIDFQNITVAIANHIVNQVQQGMGLWCQTNNPQVPYRMDAYAILAPILPVSITIDANGIGSEVVHEENQNINTREGNTTTFLTDRISFLSLPQLLNLSITIANANTQVIVESDTNYPILSLSNFGQGMVMMLSAPVRNDSNEHLADWPMFNYLIFASAMSLSGVNTYESFGNWEWSPVPHESAKIGVNLVLIAITIITIVAFVRMRKKSKKEPLVLLPETVENMPIVAKPKVTDAEKDQKEQETLKKTLKTWQDVGFHKPMAGFSIMFFLALGLVLPVAIVIIYILPTFILQDPAQFGILFISGNIFSAVFMAGDFGLAQAFDRYVGEEYVKNPREAVKYIQFFVWFQMLSGLVQTVVIALLGLYVIPNNLSMAFMSYQFMLKAFIQWPGCGYMFVHALKSLQRTDKEQTVNLISLIFFDLAGIAVFSSMFLGIGKADPRIGTVVGGALGLSFAEVIRVFGFLLLSGWALNSVDKRFKLGDCFRVDFDIVLVKRTLLFGLKSMLSTVIFLLGNFAITIIIMLQLPNYTYWGAFLGSATILLYPITFMIILFENMLPTTAEAYGAGCKRLTELYVSYGFKYWGLFGILIFVVFSFFVNTFLSILLPPLFRPMGFFIGFYAITKVFANLGDYSRLFLVSIDKISHYVLFVTLEQILRVVIMIALITKISHPEYLLIFGELPGAIFKSILTWVYTNKKILKVRINIWQSIIAPSVASMLILLIGLGLNPIYMNAITQFNGDALIPTIIYSLFVCLGLALTFYPFIVGLLGGWDTRSLQDFEFAAYHSGPSKPFALLFYKMSVIGSRISPLFNRFPTYDANIDEEIQILKVLKEKSRDIK